MTRITLLRLFLAFLEKKFCIKGLKFNLKNILNHFTTDVSCTSIQISCKIQILIHIIQLRYSVFLSTNLNSKNIILLNK